MKTPDKPQAETDPGQCELNRELKDANTTLALGAGVGALGTGTALLTGAVCPFCYVAVPALLGMGLYKRRQIKKRNKPV
ncbi:MAG: hypothetical protein G8D58_13125 [gamma proteobacterium symbiont of Phacoides pectinatus]